MGMLLLSGLERWLRGRGVGGEGCVCVCVRVSVCVPMHNDTTGFHYGHMGPHSDTRHNSQAKQPLESMTVGKDMQVLLSQHGHNIH